MHFITPKKKNTKKTTDSNHLESIEGGGEIKFYINI